MSMHDTIVAAPAAAVPRHRRKRTAKVWLPSAGLIAILALLILPPIIFLVQTSLVVRGPDGASIFTLTHFAQMIQDPRLYISLWNSVVFSVLSTIVGVLYGAAIAWTVERTDARFSLLAYLTVFMSLGMPHILHVAGWQYMLGRQGPFNQIYMQLAGTREVLFDVYSMSGMVFVQGILWAPLVFLLLSAIFRRSNAELEEAARICGASVYQTVKRVSFRLAWPAIVGMSIFVFIRNLESFDVPLLIGYRAGISMLTTDIYLSMTRVPPDMGHAGAFSVTLVVLLSILLFFYGRYAQSADRFATVTGKAFRPRAFALGRWRWLGSAVVVSNFVLVVVVPLIALAWNSFLPFQRPMWLSETKAWTLDNYRLVLDSEHNVELVLNTLGVAAAAATITMALATVAGWLVVRRWRWSGVIEQLITMPLVFPGIILGVALIIVGLRAPIPLYGTLTIIALAFIIRFLPYGMRYAHGGVLQIHRELEEAARAAGASQWMVLRRIVMPLLFPAIIAGWLFIFLISANELSMSVLLAGPKSHVMAVAIYELWGNGQGVEVYALGTLWTVFMTACALILFVVARRTSASGTV
jgi:iron(III) transport system permease protein